MHFENVTIKDIAKALNISTSTVSRALRDSYEISEDTKKIVREYAEKVRYRPNPIAVSLKMKKSQSIGVIVTEIDNTYFSQAINGIESVAHELGYNVIITQSHENAERELKNMHYLASRSVDGLIISVSGETADFSPFKELHAKGLPMVFFDRVVNDINTHKVIADDFLGAYTATKHLIGKGHTTIIALAGSATLSNTVERVNGYVAALQEAGLSSFTNVQYCPHGGADKKEIQTLLDAQLHTLESVAILCLSDKITIATLQYLQAKKIAVPEKVALVGFLTSGLCSLFQPPLTVVRQQAFEMGQTAMKQLHAILTSKRKVEKFETIKLAAKFIERDSV